jgi:hypothetical protein
MKYDDDKINKQLGNLSILLIYPVCSFYNIHCISRAGDSFHDLFIETICQWQVINSSLGDAALKEA